MKERGRCQQRAVCGLLVVAVLVLSGCGPQEPPATQPGQVPTGAGVPASPAPTRRQPTATERATSGPAGGVVLGSAKEWYPVAEAKAWQGDAFLALIEGENVVMGIDLYEVQAPFSGQVASWVYHFFSPSQGKLFFVTVGGGQVTDALEGELIGLSPEQYVGLKAVAEWRLDSTEAVEIAKAQLKEKYNRTDYDPNERAAYNLFNTLELQVVGDAFQAVPAMYWEVWWRGYTGNPSYRVQVDATDGRVRKVSSDLD